MWCSKWYRPPQDQISNFKFSTFQYLQASRSQDCHLKSPLSPMVYSSFYFTTLCFLLLFHFLLLLLFFLHITFIHLDFIFSFVIFIILTYLFQITYSEEGVVSYFLVLRHSFNYVGLFFLLFCFVPFCVVLCCVVWSCFCFLVELCCSWGCDDMSLPRVKVWFELRWWGSMALIWSKIDPSNIIDLSLIHLILIHTNPQAHSNSTTATELNFCCLLPENQPTPTRFVQITAQFIQTPLEAALKATSIQPTAYRLAR
jgi:hypothetical protein